MRVIWWHRCARRKVRYSSVCFVLLGKNPHRAPLNASSFSNPFFSITVSGDSPHTLPKLCPLCQCRWPTNPTSRSIRASCYRDPTNELRPFLQLKRTSLFPQSYWISSTVHKIVSNPSLFPQLQNYWDPFHPLNKRITSLPRLWHCLWLNTKKNMKMKEYHVQTLIKT